MSSQAELLLSTAREDHGDPMATVSSMAIPLVIRTQIGSSSPQPLTAGIPLPRGLLRDGVPLGLCDGQGVPISVQARPLAHWPDGSIKWLLIDLLATALRAGEHRYQLITEPLPVEPQQGCLAVEELPNEIRVQTGAATFVVSRQRFSLLTSVQVDGQSLLDAEHTRLVLVDQRGQAVEPCLERIVVEEYGKVRATLRLEGSFRGRRACRLITRLCFFATCGLVRVRLTLHNPQRAHHPGGLWDLGDAGSLNFRSLALDVAPQAACATRVTWQAEAEEMPRSQPATMLEIYQDSSGGVSWQSKNHVNRHGHVPCTFRGYRVREAAEERRGLRASPTVVLSGQAGSIAAAIPEFWQQFPKAIEVHGPLLRLGLFPAQCMDGFELQGGEQKTHAFWLHFGPRNTAPDGHLAWVHQPACLAATPEWVAASAAFEPGLSTTTAQATRLEIYLAEVMGGETSLLKRREVIDEYGWRHFGEIYADHESRYYQGTAPVISHYNNQYDVVYGTLLHYLRTGDTTWLQLADPLARHVIDIDIYHTVRDKAAYSGGLFWFTDHYKSAGTCTHRTYSRLNCRPGDASYGGGPASAHNFTTGLLHYYYMTGDPNARAAVLELVQWVIHQDDGRKNILGLVDDGPTGTASCTFDIDYQGPGRGAGNSINALLDGWLLTGQREYLERAEMLIRRCIHPADDVPARDLLNVEQRWSYTVFLSVLARYLTLKAEHGENDAPYAYAQASLLHYAEWMLQHERPYFDQVEKLEFPTEAWAAQELRKANVLRLAAGHADEPLRQRLLQRGEELADRAWHDLNRFPSRTTARAMAIILSEGLRDQFFRSQDVPRSPRRVHPDDFGVPVSFVPQRRRVQAQLRSLRGLLRIAIRFTYPKTWWLAWQLVRAKD